MPVWQPDCTCMAPSTCARQGRTAAFLLWCQRPTIVLKRRMTAHQYYATCFFSESFEPRRGILPVFLDVVRKTPKRNTWRMDLSQITVYDALRVGQYVDQSSSRGLEKLGEDILTSPEVIRAQTLHFKPNFKFSRLIFFGGGTPVPVVVCAIKPWSISSACKKLKGQHPLRAEI